MINQHYFKKAGHLEKVYGDFPFLVPQNQIYYKIMCETLVLVIRFSMKE